MSDNAPRAGTTKGTRDTKTALTWRAACGGLAIC